MSTETGWLLHFAPHVDRRWSDEFVLELRLAGVGGAQIGAALAEVEAHVVDSREPAAEAFGDPVAYARSLGLKPSPARSTTATLLSTLPTMLSLVGLWVVIYSVHEARTGDDVTVLTGAVLAALLMVGALLAVAHWSQAWLRFVFRRRVLGPLAVIVAVAALASLLLLAQRGAAFGVPSRPALVVGLVLVAGATAWSFRTRNHAVDLIRGPLDDAPAVSPATRAASTLAIFFPAALTVLMCALSLFSGR